MRTAAIHNGKNINLFSPYIIHNSHPKLLFHVINCGLFIKVMGCSLCLDYNNVNPSFLPETGICDHRLVKTL